MLSCPTMSSTQSMSMAIQYSAAICHLLTALAHPYRHSQLPPSDVAPTRVIRNDEETLAQLIRETERCSPRLHKSPLHVTLIWDGFVRGNSKMVNVQDPHPFLLRPPPLRTSLSHSHSFSRSRSPSPSGSHSMTPDRRHSERSGSSAHPPSAPRDPILEVKIIKTCKAKTSRLCGKGRGRARTNAREGSPLTEDGMNYLGFPAAKFQVNSLRR